MPGAISVCAISMLEDRCADRDISGLAQNVRRGLLKERPTFCCLLSSFFGGDFVFETFRGSIVHGYGLPPLSSPTVYFEEKMSAL